MYAGRAKKSSSETKKEEIIVPKIEIVERIGKPKKFAKVDANYIRITRELNLPKLIDY